VVAVPSLFSEEELQATLNNSHTTNKMDGFMKGRFKSPKITDS
jgi:hypothetical protein